MFDILNQGWIGSLIGLVGVVLGVFGVLSYRASRIGARPAFLLHSRKLIGKEKQKLPDEVEVYHV